MKNYNILLSGLITASMLFACEDKLEVTDPQNITEDIALTSDKNVKLVLTGTYDALSVADMFGGNLLRNAELLAANDEITFTGTFPEPSEIYSKQIVTANGNVSAFWFRAYATINTANNVIGALSVVNEGDRTQVEGEALFLRGLSYFELIKMFGKAYADGNPSTNPGVPIVTTPTRGLDERVTAPRDNVAAVYVQIIQDLTRAATLLSSNNSAIRASKETANAVLSRVYLQMNDFEKARDAAHAVISSNRYSMTTLVNAYNGGTTTEDVFNIPVSVTDGVNQMQTFYAAKNVGGRGDIEIKQKHLDLYEDGDARLNLFYSDPATNVMRTSKWTNQFGNVKVIRIAEMYLTRAEANFRLGTSIGASPLADVNRIRSRAGLADLGSVTSADILIERRLELAHEGQRLHDIKRLEETISEGALTYPFNSNNLIFPIPQRERNVNPNLVQNPGYF